jgi:hypothetical protein
MWVAVIDSHLKAWMPPFQWSAQAWAHAHVEIAFTVMALVLTWQARRLARSCAH